MPRRLKLTSDDYKKGTKRFWVSLPISEMESLIEQSEYLEPALRATMYVRDRIALENKKRKVLPGQTHLFGRG